MYVMSQLPQEIINYIVDCVELHSDQHRQPLGRLCIQVGARRVGPISFEP